MIDRYIRKDMARIWNDQTRYETWFNVELAACRAMERLNMVPAGTADSLEKTIQIDAVEIAEIEKNTHHDMISFLTHIEEQDKTPARWIHFGMTSSDVLDTAFTLQLQQAGDLLFNGMNLFLDALEKRAYQYKNLAMIGRTHGMHAEPITMGIVFAGFWAETKRNYLRLKMSLTELCTGKLSGAVGVYGNISPEVEELALKSLGLTPETVATQVIPRDRHAQFFNVLALVACGIERFALQVRHWQRSEVAEVNEPFGGFQKGSSAMPHKRNPILSENLCGLARLVRGYASAALENIALWHERDISHSSVERIIAPDATALVDFMLNRACHIVNGLTVNEEQIARNLHSSGELIFSEAVLLALIQHGVSRQFAYKHVQDCAKAAFEKRGTFKDLLAVNSTIISTLSTEELDHCFDLQRHLTHVDQIFEKTFGE